jgi:hypothetical protein
MHHGSRLKRLRNRALGRRLGKVSKRLLWRSKPQRNRPFNRALAHCFEVQSLVYRLRSNRALSEALAQSTEALHRRREQRGNRAFNKA